MALEDAQKDQARTALPNPQCRNWVYDDKLQTSGYICKKCGVDMGSKRGGLAARAEESGQMATEARKALRAVVAEVSQSKPELVSKLQPLLEAGGGQPKSEEDKVTNPATLSSTLAKMRKAEQENKRAAAHMANAVIEVQRASLRIEAAKKAWQEAHTESEALHRELGRPEEENVARLLARGQAHLGFPGAAVAQHLDGIL